MRRAATVVGLAAMVCTGAAAQETGFNVCGLWQTEDGDGHVRIERCGESVCGALAWMSSPDNPDGTPKRDINNDNPELRQRTLLGMPLLWGFERGDDARWRNGRIYNPEDGNTYRSSIEPVSPGELRVRGCFFIFCGGETWTRLEHGEDC